MNAYFPGCSAGITVALFAGTLGLSAEFKDGPFDGRPFRPQATVRWAVTNSLPESLMVYRVVTEEVSRAVVSNAMAIGSFRPINLVRSGDNTLIEFRDRHRMEELTRFLKISADKGYITYTDNRAGGFPVRGVPGYEEAERLALRYFILLGGNTNEIMPRPWPHSEETTSSFEKPSGRELGKVVSGRRVCLFRQIGGVQVIGNAFDISFRNDAKPAMFEMEWANLQPAQPYRTATQSEVLGFVMHGKAFYPVWPEPVGDVSVAKSFSVKRITPFYRAPGLGVGPQEYLRPFAALDIDAELGSKTLPFRVYCPIVSDERVP